MCRRFDQGPDGAGREKVDKYGETYWTYSLVEGAGPAWRDWDDTPTAPAGTPRAEDGTLHEAYSILLDQMDLFPEHRKALRARGLTDEEITRRGYRTLPLQGRKAYAGIVVRRLGDEVAASIPGLFVRTGDDGGRWWTLGGVPGLVIPTRDADGRILALRIRADDPGRVGKYSWMTSAGELKGYGPSPGIKVHVPLLGEQGNRTALRGNQPGQGNRTARAEAQGNRTVLPGDGAEADRTRQPHREVSTSPPRDDEEQGNRTAPPTPRTVRLTEGELKADVATALSGVLTIALPGVGYWRHAEPVLRAVGATEVVLAFDADARRNKSVAFNLRNAAEGLAQAGFAVRLEVWDEALGKGIDDLLAAGHRPELRSGDEVWLEVAQIAAEAGVPKSPIEEVDEALSVLADTRDKQAFLSNEAVLRALGTLYQTSDHRHYIRAAETAAAVGLARRDFDAAVKPFRSRKPHLRAVAPGEKKRKLIVDAVEDAPVTEDQVVPPGWYLGARGLARMSWSEGGDGKPEPKFQDVAEVPLLVTGRLHDVTEGTEALRLSWPRDGAWRHHTADRAQLRHTSKVVDLAGLGLPVSSNNNSDIVAWLVDYERTNIAAIPRASVSRQMGWQGHGGDLGFLWGRSLIRANGEMTEANNLEAIDPRAWDRSWISFRGADSGEEQLADAFHAAGTFEAWRTQVAEEAAKYPRVGLAIYAALAPPVLDLVGARNFIVDWSGLTSTGKTITLHVGASCWGNGDERAADSLVGQWDATRVWVERASTVLRGLPLILDDTKKAKKPDDVARVLYDVAMGRGRGRGSVKGLRRTGTWATVLLSTGEQPATTFTRDGGTVARCLVLWGNPFGDATPTMAPTVQKLDLAALTHYGHAGPALVQFLNRHRSRWKAWKARHHELNVHYIEKAAGRSVASRIAAHLATLHLTAELAHEALGLSWDPGAIIGALWEDIVREVGDADRPFQALAHVISWASANEVTFWGRHLWVSDQNDAPRQVPAAGWSGRWDKVGWEWLGVFPHRLQEVLERGEFDIEATLRTWKDRGWLLTEEKHLSRAQRVQGKLCRLYCLTRKAVEAVTGEDLDPVPPDDQGPTPEELDEFGLGGLGL